MHKDSIRKCQKVGLRNLVKSPMMHKAISKSTKMLTNWLSQVGKIMRDGKTTHTCLY